MPRQETFLVEKANGIEIEVLKTFDRSYAHEVLRAMSADALKSLAAALDLTEKYESSDIPDPDGADYEDFIWEELCEGAREDVRQDPNLYSFFVVVESKAGRAEELYVSPDWPSAEAFAKRRLAAA